MNNEALQKAIDSLRIHDVYLHGMESKCLDGFDPKYKPGLEQLQTQTLHQVRKSQLVETDDGRTLLKVYVALGTRWVETLEPGEETVKAIIEAEFVAEYGVDQALEREAISEFSLQNASYHVWPYWRELLASQCDRMRLPRVIAPTFQLASNRDDPR